VRIVIDTHIFLGRIVPLLNANLDFLHRDKIVIVVNDDIIHEYIGRAKSHGYRATEIDIIIRRLFYEGHLVRKGMSACNLVDVPNVQLQDELHIIRLAVVSHAEYIITNDYDDLLVHHDKIEREYGIQTIRPENLDIFF